MTAVASAWIYLLAMTGLIVCSAFFSGSEAALFSLTHRNRKGLSRTGVGGRISARLLEQPDRLLSAILFWNLLINMTYFALAAIVGGSLEADPAAGRAVAVTFTVLSLLTIIFCSEMLPKSLAVLSPLRVSVLVGPPLAVAVRLVGPILPLVRVTNLAVSRLVWPNLQSESEIDLTDIERAIELGTDDAALLQRERMALRGLVQMAETRVGELMQPRNKLWICEGPPSRAVIAEGMSASGYLLIASPDGTVTSSIAVRMLRPSQLDDLANMVEPVIYVPWSALVSQVLDQLNEEDRSVAVVVDEFGEMVGALSIDDILRRVLAPSEQAGAWGEASLQQLDAHRYRVAGSVSIRALAKRLGIEVVGEGFTTVAGFIQRHNERLPRPGDEAPMDRYRLTVTDEPGQDVLWIDVRLAADPEEPPR